MRFAIADPPYLGRADRWYGEGRGSGRVRVAGRVRNMHKPDHHPDASRWDDPAEHAALVARLEAEFDGWAVAGHATSCRVLLEAAPRAAQLAVWSRPNAVPGGARVCNSWEPVLIRVPDSMRDRSSGMRVRDVLHASVRQQGFVGSKPPEWTRWVLEMLGYDAGRDELVDVFPGSGAVAAAADGMLSFSSLESVGAS